MNTYICKCGKTFQKSTGADTTGYILNDYNQQHECYGCPYIVIYRDWQTKEITKRECRATPSIDYNTRCRIGIEPKDYTMSYLYTLDLVFAKRVYNYIQLLDGAEKDGNCIPTEWRAADFDECNGLIKFPLFFKSNKSGTAARKEIKSTFFNYDGRRKGLAEISEQEIILERIEIAKENATIKIKSEEENNMTAFNLGEMLGANISTGSQIKQLPCDQCVPYFNHQFELYTGERLDDMVQSIKENGVLIPTIQQPINDELIRRVTTQLNEESVKDEQKEKLKKALEYYTENKGKYEILIGHNRWNGSKLADIPTVPAIIKEGLTPEEAEMYVIESNLMQRGFDNLKISEQAAVIASRYEKMFSQGKRTDIIKELQSIESSNVQSDEEDEQTKPKNSREKVGEEYGLSRNSVARLLRINKLIFGLKKLVDEHIIPIRAAVDLSYLSDEEQNMVVNPAKKFKVDMKKAELLRDLSEAKGLNLMTVIRILNGSYLAEQKPLKPKTVKLSNDTYSKYFKDDVQPDEVTQTIEKALEMYFTSM